MQQPFLRIENICKSFSGVEVLKNVNMELEQGKIHALIGENGAGKSTLMKILLGVDTNWQLVSKGVLIVLAVFLDYETGRLSGRLRNRLQNKD